MQQVAQNQLVQHNQINKIDKIIPPFATKLTPCLQTGRQVPADREADGQGGRLGKGRLALCSGR